MATGGCYCGQIRFNFEGEPAAVVSCHCSQCRKFSGHYVAAVSGAQDVNISGEVKWFESSPGFQRGFCSNCGSQLFWRDLARGHLSIMAGAFDEGTKLKAQDHIYVGDKADYYEISDGLPQYEERRI